MPSRVGFVIGNGLSREDFDLKYLDGCGVTVGCNRLHEDYEPNILVAIDTAMVTTLKAIKGPHRWTLLTREVLDNVLMLTYGGKPVKPFWDMN